MNTARIARSAAGRDKDGWFIIVGEQEGYYLICDGKRRPIEKPKRKNHRHVELTDDSLPMEGIKTNRALRRALTHYSAARKLPIH